jgi:3-oxoacyl-[acyl-carrier-protein] synthase II
MGLVTSLGETVEGVWEAILAGKSGIGPVKRWDPAAKKFPVTFGGECTSFDVTQYGVDSKEARRLDRFAQFGMAASVSAIKDSGLDFTKEDRFRCGVLIGTGIGGIETLQDQTYTLAERGVSRVSPFTVPRLMANAASGNVSIMFGLNGGSCSVATACATGADALGSALRNIRHGYADVVIAGGSEAALCEVGLGSFCAARALSTRNEEPAKASRPWDKDRDGFVMGEGAGVLVLEDLDHAKARGARIYAELIGYAASSDAYHITAPHEEGLGASAAMREALKDAGVNPDEIDYINAHGTSTLLGDVAETKAVKSVFGPSAYKLALSSTKSQLGHLLGASGGIEAIFSTLAVCRNLIPPTINLDNPSEECDLDYVPHKARERKVTTAMSNSFGFGGHNGCVVIRKF